MAELSGLRLGWIRAGSMRVFRSAILPGVLLSACGSGGITAITHKTRPTPPNASPDQKAEITEQNRIVLDRPGATFVVNGRGTCDKIRVRYGDGGQEIIDNPDLQNGVERGHTYKGWGGPKTVSVETVTNCIGSAKTSVTVEPIVKRFAIGFPGAEDKACHFVPNAPTVRKGAIVTTGAAVMPETQINFGCVGPICDRRGIDGSPAIALGPPFTFPFPGLKAYSLVWRLGTQIEQGGIGRSFTASETGSLEACVNDDVLTNNSGAWGFTVTVDESNVP